MTERRGNCPTTGKRMFSTRGEAKRYRDRKHWDTAVFKCGDCGGYFHIGGWQGVKDRAAHRELHGGGRSMVGVDISVRMAAEELNVTPEFLGQLIEDGKLDARLNHEGKWRVATETVRELKQRLEGEAA
ncbi:hypothetical protein [Citricoccus sp. K5]|uniref:hypothetical protein n=1 Tax=Citricoccus sp. K5 TaxID=2653135 RepID=UPI0012F2F2BE|nr:hypothetical protein [Citricoccus sp. K5]VXB23593.1 hypothetical protein CITRIK5_30008 [Citricoccus sp. K5]